MNANLQVACDGCGRDLSTTGNSEAWRLVLAVEPIPVRDGMVADLHVPKPLACLHRFCGVRCLAEWAAKSKS